MGREQVIDFSMPYLETGITLLVSNDFSHSYNNNLVRNFHRSKTKYHSGSLKINSGRERVIDFSVPYLETGITVLVSQSNENNLVSYPVKIKNNVSKRQGSLYWFSQL